MTALTNMSTVSLLMSGYKIKQIYLTWIKKRYGLSVVLFGVFMPCVFSVSCQTLVHS